MFSFLVKRLVNAFFVILGVSALVFVLFNIVGGDPALIMAGKHATAEQVARIRHEYGFDRPLFIQFLSFLKEIATFDFGKSYSTRQTISKMISDGMIPTLSLAIPAFLITTIVSLLIGLTVAYYRGKLIDRIAVIICVIGMSVPALGYILFGQYIMAYKMDLFPISGYDASLVDRWRYIFLPMLIWVFLSVGYEVRFYRTAFLEEVNQDYVRTARAKGLSESFVYLKHVLKNTMIPIITNVILEIPLLLLGAFLLESFFGIPGLGGITIGAIQNSDLPVIKAMTIFVSVLYVFGTLMTDIAYSLVDPRVRLK